MAIDTRTETPKVSVGEYLRNNIREYGLLLALVVIMLLFQFLTNGVLFRPVNITNLVLQNSFIVIMALGMLLIIVAGHIDLSVGSVAAFTGAVAAWLTVDLELPVPIVIILTLMVGGLIGAAQGYWVAYWRIPSFIVTLGGLIVWRGAAWAALAISSASENKAVRHGPLRRMQSSPCARPGWRPLVEQLTRILSRRPSEKLISACRVAAKGWPCTHSAASNNPMETST